MLARFTPVAGFETAPMARMERQVCLMLQAWEENWHLRVLVIELDRLVNVRVVLTKAQVLDCRLSGIKDLVGEAGIRADWKHD